MLTDDERRKVYDNHGEEGLKNMQSGGGDPFDPFSRYCCVKFYDIQIILYMVVDAEENDRN